MSQSIINVLVKAKEMDKWVAVKHLTKYGVYESFLLRLEDQGLLIRYKNGNDILIKLTAKGYHHYSS